MRFIANKESVELGIKTVPYNYEDNKPLTVKTAGEAGITVTNVMPENLTTNEEKQQWSANTLAEIVVEVGQIYTVRQYTEASGKRNYHYAYYYNGFDKINSDVDRTNIYGNLKGATVTRDNASHNNDTDASTLVQDASNGLYYKMVGHSKLKIEVVLLLL